MDGGVAIGGGGGVIGLVIVIAFVLLGGSPGDLGALSGQVIGDDGVGPASTALANECKTGADANAREDCRIVGYVNSIQAYWTDSFARSGSRYQPARTRFFTGQISTGCGFASAASGPFYCPTDRYVYIDLGFFDDLRTKFGATGRAARRGLRPRPRVRPSRPGPGRRVVGAVGRQRARTARRSGPSSRPTATPASGRTTPRRPGYLQPITDAQIADALDAAAAVGDDRIQEQVQGGVDPDSWTHGSAAQRQKWFSTGYRPADPDACDTFSGTP